MADYDAKRMHVLDGLKPVERPEHMKRWADEFLAAPGAYEPMILRKLRENAEAVRNMGRETPDGVRHLERKVDGAWLEVAVFPPRADWQAP